MREGPFQCVVFPGGGCRCFWQLGFWEVVAPELRLEPRVVTGVSAGSAMCCAALAGRGPFALEIFKEMVAHNSSNFYPHNLLSSRRLTPHLEMYRSAIMQIIGPDELRALHQGPEILIFFTRPPGLLGPGLSLLLGLTCYLLEKGVSDTVETSLCGRVGFSAHHASIRQCATPADLADLTLVSSCTPPFTPALRREGRLVLDGSLVEAAPMPPAEYGAGRTLVLLSRRYGGQLPNSPDKVFVHPSVPVPVSKWDYTNPAKLQQTYDLGRRDGESFLCSAEAKAASG